MNTCWTMRAFGKSRGSRSSEMKLTQARWPAIANTMLEMLLKAVGSEGCSVADMVAYEAWGDTASAIMVMRTADMMLMNAGFSFWSVLAGS